MTFARRVSLVISVEVANHPRSIAIPSKASSRTVLPTPRRPRDQEALLGPPQLEPAEEQRELLELRVAAGKRRRRVACARRVRIPQGVHKEF